jgi:hypothetical protein
MTTDAPYGENLRYCCDHFKSISAVCRKLDFNRQQFNKYLNGLSVPSRHNHKRLSDFFGLDYHELLMPHEDFIAIFEKKRQSVPGEVDMRVVNQIVDLLGTETTQTRTYAGYYYKYYHSMTDPTKIKRDLCHFYMHRGILYTSIKCKFLRDYPVENARFWTYRGTIALLRGRLFWMEFDRELEAEVTLSILVPSPTRVITQLEGLVLGTGLDRNRRIVAGRIVLEFLGRKIDRKHALAQVGVFEKHETAIPQAVKDLLLAAIPQSEAVLQLQ